MPLDLLKPKNTNAFSAALRSKLLDRDSPQNSYSVRILGKREVHGRTTTHELFVDGIPGKMASRTFYVSDVQFRACETGSRAIVAVTPGGLGMPRALFTKPSDLEDNRYRGNSESTN